MAEDSDLVEYYGTECHFCIQMAPLIEKLEAELGITIRKVETWHNEANKKEWEAADAGKCGGVPFFLNKKSGKFICGATSYEKLKEWAEGK